MLTDFVPEHTPVIMSAPQKPPGDELPWVPFKHRAQAMNGLGVACQCLLWLVPQYPTEVIVGPASQNGILQYSRLLGSQTIGKSYGFPKGLPCFSLFADPNVENSKIVLRFRQVLLVFDYFWLALGETAASGQGFLIGLLRLRHLPALGIQIA